MSGVSQRRLRQSPLAITASDEAPCRDMGGAWLGCRSPPPTFSHAGGPAGGPAVAPGPGRVRPLARLLFKVAAPLAVPAWLRARWPCVTVTVDVRTRALAAPQLEAASAVPFEAH